MISRAAASIYLSMWNPSSKSPAWQEGSAPQPAVGPGDRQHVPRPHRRALQDEKLPPARPVERTKAQATAQRLAVVRKAKRFFRATESPAARRDGQVLAAVVRARVAEADIIAPWQVDGHSPSHCPGHVVQCFEGHVALSAQAAGDDRAVHAQAIGDLRLGQTALLDLFLEGTIEGGKDIPQEVCTVPAPRVGEAPKEATRHCRISLRNQAGTD